MVMLVFPPIFGSQKFSSWEIEDLGEIYLFVTGPDIKNEALDANIEVSGPKI